MRNQTTSPRPAAATEIPTSSDRLLQLVWQAVAYDAESRLIAEAIREHDLDAEVGALADDLESVLADAAATRHQILRLTAVVR